MAVHLRNLALPVWLALLAGIAAAHADGSASPASAPTTGSPAASPPRGGAAALAGRWIVDLRPSPEEPRYEKPMVLEVAADGTVRGTFYDSTIDAGRVGASNGRTCFAFRTTDGVGPYHTSGCLSGDRIVGQTWAEHRAFVLNWTAVRDATSP